MKEKSEIIYGDMKKLILLALAAVMMVGCKGEIKTIDGYPVIVVDSCEYIASINQLAHKGNCRFCKERREKELKELVELLKEK